jgi:IS30 family transposase
VPQPLLPRAGRRRRAHANAAHDHPPAIYFCDRHSPWQRATNENTDGLLGQYFPIGTDLSVHTEAHLDAVADELNDRPRKRLQFQEPIEKVGPLLLR